MSVTRSDLARTKDAKTPEIATNGRARTSAKQPSAPTAAPEPLGPYTITGRIECALQRLQLLEWALCARLDGDEHEVFTSPISDVMHELRGLCEEIHRRDVAPWSHRRKRNSKEVA